MNAREAMPGGGTLVFETDNADLKRAHAWRNVGAEPGARVQLSISGNGADMTNEVISRLSGTDSLRTHRRRQAGNNST
jgi:two-component system cell cycle sensor histidine kinase/response regulator CckA